MRWMAVRIAVFGVSVGLISGAPDSTLSAQEIVEPQPQRVSQFSGKPVPRFETLRYSEVNGRVGPSLEHPIRWRYEREGLPVLIVKESQDWRRVQDPDGEEVWMHARMLRADRQTGSWRYGDLARPVGRLDQGQRGWASRMGFAKRHLGNRRELARTGTGGV